MESACFRASPTLQSLIWGKKNPFWWCYLPFPCHSYSLLLLKRKMLISKSPICLQHTLGGGSPGSTNRRCGYSSGGLRAVGWGLRPRQGWTRLPGHARAIQLLFVSVVIYALVIISACWVIYDWCLWKKVLQPLIGVLLLAKLVGAGDRKQPEEYASSLLRFRTSSWRQKKTPTCITVAHF